MRAGRRRGAIRQAPLDGRLTLDRVRDGSVVRVLRIGGGRQLVHRLAALGVVPGATMTVTRNRCPALVSVNGSRLAVGRNAAAAVEVEGCG